ncbi:methionine ABC transporter ATP-binding protein [Bordetella genomosp. 9]|uniref:Cell division ATP-binding protein FtsE n=1 Tax=Bordetella genomosp. 9 TaxID=1416803 RepID=A0A1W6YX10_9BORD|nr:ATP-binding cassette domain-containing protein [Bordetella genomosp. 9]ARP85635.1 phosphate ABC transporter ATP-binding protein [Bordetella genomosp. 9]ARP89609.1 phosphate ABC transporter ATP-binding protein [Bordetella genomosp. 9]
MIHIQNLHKTYATPHGRFEALRGITLHIAQGEVFGIIGPSGAGKSTLVQCINLLERPDEGTISIGNQSLTGLPEVQLRQQRRRIGMVFQGFNLLARRTVYGNVALPLEIAGVPRADIPARVERLLRLVGLEHLRDRFPAQISGGQKQRVGIARALANEPDVLLSDEATSALDPETTHNILALLRDINRQTGVTVVMITHQMEVVREICDRVAVLSQGQIVELGRTAEIFASPRHEVTKAMVSAATASELTDATLQALRARMRDAVSARPDAAVHLLRLSLGGAQGAGDVLSDLSRRFSLDVSLIQARIEDVQGIAVGTAFVLVQGATQALQHALSDLAARDIAVQELAHEPATTDRSSHYVAA